VKQTLSKAILTLKVNLKLQGLSHVPWKN
jgi:hypothetical protein